MVSRSVSTRSRRPYRGSICGYRATPTDVSPIADLCRIIMLVPADYDHRRHVGMPGSLAVRCPPSKRWIIAFPLLALLFSSFFFSSSFDDRRLFAICFPVSGRFFFTWSVIVVRKDGHKSGLPGPKTFSNEFLSRKEGLNPYKNWPYIRKNVPMRKKKMKRRLEKK